MQMLVFWILVFVLSLTVLIKASDYFTNSAEKVGRYFGIPSFIIGVTIVAIGTSLPELVSSIFAVIDGSSEIVIGNVVGSNITNIFLILGITAVLSKKIKVSYELIHVDLPLLVASAFLLMAAAWDGVFNYREGLLFLAGLTVYILYTISTSKLTLVTQIEKEIKRELPEKKISPMTFVILIASAIFISIGAKYTVESVMAISELTGIATNIIAVSAVALGTSLPELAVSVTAVSKGKPEMAVGNILGSNIFNVFAVMAFPSFFGDLVIPTETIYFYLPIMLAATLLYFFITQDKQISKWEGAMLLIFYIFFIGKVLTFF